MKYVALLRGINIGGNNIISMSQLSVTFQEAGFGDVKTYINSGNVVFSADGDPVKIRSRIEQAILHDFGLPIVVQLRTAAQIKAVADAVPDTWVNADGMKCDVMFLDQPIDSPNTIELLHPKNEIEDLRYIPGAIIWRVERHNYGKSRVPKMIGTDLYKNMTLRNINTVRKLHTLLSQ